jgi:hypothetical protein
MDIESGDLNKELSVDRNDLAYLAGILDADGSFSIHCQFPRGARKARGNPTLLPMIQIKQVQLEAIALLAEIFGGSIRQVRASSKNGKSLFYWRVESQNAVVVTKALLPFMRLKKRQAELLVELQAEIDKKLYCRVPATGRNRWGKITTTHYRRVAPDSMRRRLAILDESRKLNDSRYPNRARTAAEAYKQLAMESELGV